MHFSSTTVQGKLRVCHCMKLVLFLDGCKDEKISLLWGVQTSSVTVNRSFVNLFKKMYNVSLPLLNIVNKIIFYRQSLILPLMMCVSVCTIKRINREYMIYVEISWYDLDVRVVSYCYFIIYKIQNISNTIMKVL